MTKIIILSRNIKVIMRRKIRQRQSTIICGGTEVSCVSGRPSTALCPNMGLALSNGGRRWAWPSTICGKRCKIDKYRKHQSTHRAIENFRILSSAQSLTFCGMRIKLHLKRILGSFNYLEARESAEKYLASILNFIYSESNRRRRYFTSRRNEAKV